MQLVHHDKKYDNELAIIEIDVTLKLSPLDEIDNIIYYLICAQQKRNENEKIAFEARVESAYEKLKTYVKKLDN